MKQLISNQELADFIKETAKKIRQGALHFNNNQLIIKVFGNNAFIWAQEAELFLVGIGYMESLGFKLVSSNPGQLSYGVLKKKANVLGHIILGVQIFFKRIKRKAEKEDGSLLPVGPWGGVIDLTKNTPPLPVKFSWEK